MFLGEEISRLEHLFTKLQSESIFDILTEEELKAIDESTTSLDRLR